MINIKNNSNSNQKYISFVEISDEKLQHWIMFWNHWRTFKPRCPYTLYITKIVRALSIKTFWQCGLDNENARRHRQHYCCTVRFVWKQMTVRALYDKRTASALQRSDEKHLNWAPLELFYSGVTHGNRFVPPATSLNMSELCTFFRCCLLQ